MTHQPTDRSFAVIVYQGRRIIWFIISQQNRMNRENIIQFTAEFDYKLIYAITKKAGIHAVSVKKDAFIETFTKGFIKDTSIEASSLNLTLYLIKDTACIGN